MPSAGLQYRIGGRTAFIDFSPQSGAYHLNGGFLMNYVRRTVSFLLSAVMVISLFIGGADRASAAGSSFTDVPTGHWAWPYVELAAQKGYINGIGNGLFSPDTAVTYADFTALLTRAFFSEELQQIDASSPWYLKNCVAAEGLGLYYRTAYTGPLMAGSTELSRIEMATMICNTLEAYGMDIWSSYSWLYLLHDLGIPDGNYYLPAEKFAIDVVYSRNLMNGTDENGTFSGRSSLTRAQAATILIRVEQYLTGETPVFPEPDPEPTPQPQPQQPAVPSQPAANHTVSPNAVLAIDRIQVSDNVRSFYSFLDEATDGDGVQDYLIDDVYFSGDAATGRTDHPSVGQLFMEGSTVYLVVGVENAYPGDPEQYADEMSSVYFAFLIDHPEIFWLNAFRYYYYHRPNWDGTTQVILYMVLHGDKGDMREEGYQNEGIIRAGIQQREQAVNQILAGVQPGMSTYDKVLYFHDWLTTNNGYSTLYENCPVSSRTCLSAFAGLSGPQGPVCEGYAEAFKVLCDRSGIPCTVTTSTNHMWNSVQMDDGNWYALDATFDDPIRNGHEADRVSSIENHNYFLVGSGTVPEGDRRPFSATHVATDAIYPITGIVSGTGPVISPTAYPGRNF